MASIVPGATSWPWRTRSVSSRTTVSPIATSSSPPSRVSTLPRRKTSQSRCSSSVRMIASPGPASSAATSLESSICLRATRPSASPSPPRSRACRRRGPSPCGMTSAITLPISFGELAPDSATASPTIACSSVVGDLLGQVGADQLGLALLGAGEVVAARVAVRGGGLEPALALALEHLDLVGRRRPSPPSGARTRSAAARPRARDRPALRAAVTSDCTCSSTAIRSKCRPPCPRQSRHIRLLRHPRRLGGRCRGVPVRPRAPQRRLRPRARAGSCASAGRRSSSSASRATTGPTTRCSRESLRTLGRRARLPLEREGDRGASSARCRAGSRSPTRSRRSSGRRRPGCGS